MTDMTGGASGTRLRMRGIGVGNPLDVARAALVVGLVAVPVVLVGLLGYATYARYGVETAMGIAVGAASVVAMTETLILAARPRVLEPLFGGLDRMYVVHKWLGIAAVALMILHDQFEPDFERVVRETVVGEFASDAGELVFNAFLALVAISWFRRLPYLGVEIPYHLWRFSHRFMGALFAVVVFHQMFVDMPVDVDPTLALILNACGGVGVVAWIYTEFVAPRLRRRAFVVAAVTRQGEATSVTLTPSGRAMRWRPGQFAFLRAPEAGLAEPHPFTIASAPRADGALTFAIQGLGGWTRALPGALRAGMGVEVEGPYGRFDFRRGGPRQIWLAGGIGITPFLAWAESLTGDERRKIHLVYSLRTAADAMGIEALRAAAARTPQFTFQIVETSREGRLTAARLIDSAPFAPGDADLWFCGPRGLMATVVTGLADAGQTPRRLRFEHFELA